MSETNLLRAIFEHLQRHKPQPYLMRCYQCKNPLQVFLDPLGEAVCIIECPHCGALGATFGANFLPVSREIMSSDDAERKRQHLIGVIMKCLHGELVPLVTSIVGTEKAPAESSSESQTTHGIQDILNAVKEHEYTREDAQKIQDAYITLGVKHKQNPDDEMLSCQFEKQQELFEKVKHLL